MNIITHPGPLVHFYDHEFNATDVHKSNFLFSHSDNSTQVMEEEVAKVIVQLLADESHKFMRPHAGGIAMKCMNPSRTSKLSHD